MEVTKWVDEDIAGKVDTYYIEEELAGVSKVGILYLCTSKATKDEEDDWIDDNSGTRYLIIHLPYQLVKQSTDIRPLMLARAKERLGLAAASLPN